MPRMNVALIFPPQGHFTQPYLSLPSLAAWLRQNGIERVEQIDANIEAYDWILSKERLGRSLAKLRESGEFERLESSGGLNYSGMERYQQLSEIELIGDEVVAGIEEAKRILRSPEDFYDYEKYLWAGRTLEQGLRLFSAEFAPTRLTAHGFIMRHSIERSAEIVEAASNRDENPYIEYFEEILLPQLKAQDPDLIGISVTFPSQAIPTVTLARLIKAWKPSVHITLGGGLMAYVAEKMAKQPAIWSVIDSFVLLEGERPLLELCRVLENGGSLDEVSNLIYGTEAGVVRTTPHKDPLDIKTIPTPDFDGLPLDKYITPELVLPVAATRGCYWGKCVFCTLYTVIGPGYRGRTVEQTVEDLKILSEKHNTRSFYLAIEDLPPNMAKRLPEAILEAGLDVQWWSDARLEHEVFDQEVCDNLAKAGCKRIAFGYESSSKRVLDAMCKGIDPEASLELIQRVRNAGISVTLYAMVGFPSETLEEARGTLQTILDHQSLIQEVSVRVFYLDERSEIFKRREEFDIVEIYPDEESDLQVYYDFKATTGMSRREARDVYLEFTEALRSHFPVFQNTNMLYHELKSHYFLYLAKFGSFEKLCEDVLEVQQDAAPGEKPHRPRLVTKTMKFDRGEIDATLSSIDSRTLRPRYQSDLIEDEDRKRLDAELPTLRPSPSVLVYDPRTGEVRTLSPAAATVLERCDGQRSTEEIVSIFPAEAHEDARECLEELSRNGLLTPASPKV